MISAGDLRKGLTFEYDGDVYEVIDFQHVKPGKGAAFVRAKIKSVLSGAIKDTTFNPSEKFEKAVIETKTMQYLYNDGTLYYFMDNETYEQIPLDGSMVGDALDFMRENDSATINFYKGSPFRVTPENFVELKVTFTEPGVKGDTSSGGSKPAKVETGYTLNVPLFVNMGDVIRIDTRTGEYMSRV
ncbi:elongation factor P [Peptoniphilus koenoeneniae]|uniref:Elongation factor P n=1 Tax=Peptoniphilus koenoeneniae TaxID=507751 RepID=A0ABU0ASE5_9FIRM|nr:MULTISPECIES: elongation factor P [Peptoniphilus]ERT56881.1 translation elongation factor P [Peptoniphilus sp. BV3C26]MDQ0274184.1 elongation factor P [Peptoniphilus koenoeneniae]